MKDKDGNIIATSTGTEYTRSQTMTVDGKTYNINATYNEVVVYTDEGTPVRALQMVSQSITEQQADGTSTPVTDAPFDPSQNCHGTTFADANLVIVDGSSNSESVETILDEDGYSTKGVGEDNADIFVMRYGHDDFHSGKINDDGTVTSDHDLAKPQTTTLDAEKNAPSTPDDTKTTLYQRSGDDKRVDAPGKAVNGVHLVSAETAKAIRSANGRKTTAKPVGTFEHTAYKKKKIDEPSSN